MLLPVLQTLGSCRHQDVAASPCRTLSQTPSLVEQSIWEWGQVVCRRKGCFQSLSPSFGIEKKGRTDSWQEVTSCLATDSCGYSVWTPCELLGSRSEVIFINNKNSSNNNNNKHLLKVYYAQNIMPTALPRLFYFCHNDPSAVLETGV